MNIKCKQNTLWFSMIEILLWIFIFSLWIISVYAIIIATLNLNIYNRNYIIASNLAREQLELVRNIRDSNYFKIQKYNQINPNNTNYNNIISTWSYYKIENDFSATAWFPILMTEIPLIDFWEWEWELDGKMEKYKLCLDSDNKYIYCESTIVSTSLPIIPTKFFKYIEVSEVKDLDGVINNAMKIKSKVIWYIKWYHEFEINTIIADWKRL